MACSLLVESVMLSTFGGILGSLVAVWGVSIFETTLIPEDTPAYLTFTMDYRIHVVFRLAVFGHDGQNVAERVLEFTSLRSLISPDDNTPKISN